MTVIGHGEPDLLGTLGPFFEVIIVVGIIGILLAYYSHKAKRQRLAAEQAGTVAGPDDDSSGSIGTKTALVVRSTDLHEDDAAVVRDEASGPR